MTKRKKTKKKILLHPVMMFIILVIATILLSFILSVFDVSFTYNAISSSRQEYVPVTESVNSLLNLRGIKYIFSNTVANFANFTVLPHLLIMLLGIGVMEYSGFLKTSVGMLTKKAKKNVITFVVVLICLLASIMDNLPFIAFIPLAALIFKYGKRNPHIGIISSFAALTCGYGLSAFFTSVDSSLSKLTIMSAHILDSTYTIGSFSMMFIMMISIFIMAFLITFITENYIAPKLPKYEFAEDEILTEKKLSKPQLRGMLFAGFGSAIYLLIFLYNIIPGLPFSGNFLNYSETLYIDKLFGVDSFFSNGFVFIITILFIIWGLLYGIGAKTIKNNHDFVESLGYSLNEIGKIIVYIFASSLFISIFKQTNIGNVVVAGLTNLIASSGFSGLALVVLLFASTAIATIVSPNSLTKWAIMSSQIVPTFLSAGLTAEFAQLIFRFGESATLGLTPLFAYYIVYLSYLEKYKQGENALTLNESLKYQLPYSMVTIACLLAIIIIWYLISLPLGIGGTIAL